MKTQQKNMTSEKTGARPSAGSPPVLRLALLGFGTVGRSVARILCQEQPAGLELACIFNRNVERKKVEWVPPTVQWSHDVDSVLQSDVDIVVELIGGLEPAGDWIRRALSSGKSVVTANKQLISQKGPELFNLARRHGVHIGFEASVAGGIPVVAGLQEGLAGDEVSRISGILNGTCNYILSRMESAGLPFAEALKEAQSLGFAEADPTDDIDGLDARAKLAILAGVGLRRYVHPSRIPCHTISVLQDLDFAYARRLGCTIRQISRAEKALGRQAGIFAAVQPALVPVASPLARVQGSQNLVMTTGKYGGETVFSGHGAGGDPTAVAVLSDLIAIARGARRVATFGLPPALEEDLPESAEVLGEFAAPHYVRFTVSDRPGIVAALATVFSNHGINIDALIQEPGPEKTRLPFVITLEECSNSVLGKAMAEIGGYDFHVKPPVSLPILL